INDGLTGMALIRPTASSSVPSAFGLAGLSKPTWLSLICRNVRPRVSAAAAWSISPSECGTPPATLHKTPVPTQVMHSSTLRRLTPSSRSNSGIDYLLRAEPVGLSAARIGQGRDLFPGFEKILPRSYG